MSSEESKNTIDLGPDIPTGLDPICYLFLKGDAAQETQNPVYRRWGPIAGTVIAVSGAFYSNWLSKKPYYAGLPRTFLYGAIGAAVGVWLQNWRKEATHERDLMYFHYMTLHPEDFKPKERILYRDYLTHWIPIR